MAKVSLVNALRKVGSGFDGNSKISLVNQHVSVIDKIPESISIRIKTIYLSNNIIPSLIGLNQFKNLESLSVTHNHLTYFECKWNCYELKRNS